MVLCILSQLFFVVGFVSFCDARAGDTVTCNDGPAPPVGVNDCRANCQNNVCGDSFVCAFEAETCDDGVGMLCEFFGSGCFAAVLLVWYLFCVCCFALGTICFLFLCLGLCLCSFPM